VLESTPAFVDGRACCRGTGHAMGLVREDPGLASMLAVLLDGHLTEEGRTEVVEAIVIRARHDEPTRKSSWGP
jgi:hypothetical protein